MEAGGEGAGVAARLGAEHVAPHATAVERAKTVLKGEKAILVACPGGASQRPIRALEQLVDGAAGHLVGLPGAVGSVGEAQIAVREHGVRAMGHAEWLASLGEQLLHLAGSDVRGAAAQVVEVVRVEGERWRGGQQRVEAGGRDGQQFRLGEGGGGAHPGDRADRAVAQSGGGLVGRILVEAHLGVGKDHADAAQQAFVQLEPRQERGRRLAEATLEAHDGGLLAL